MAQRPCHSGPSSDMSGDPTDHLSLLDTLGLFLDFMINSSVWLQRGDNPPASKALRSWVTLSPYGTTTMLALHCSAGQAEPRGSRLLSCLGQAVAGRVLLLR